MTKHSKPSNKLNWGTLLAGVMIGVVLTSAVFYVFSTSGITLEIPVKQPPEHKVAAETRFDFYSELTKSSQETIKADTTPVVQQQAKIKTTKYLVRAGVFKSRAEADALRARLTLDGLSARIETSLHGTEKRFRVLLGPFKTENDAKAYQKRLKLSCNITGSIEHG